MSDVFAELRALLLKAPSMELWDDLCVFFTRLPADAPVETLLEYADNHMQEWSDELRFLSSEDFLKWMHLSPIATPEELWEALSTPEELVFWPLVRVWELESHAGGRVVPWEKVLPAHSFQHLSELLVVRTSPQGKMDRFEGDMVSVLSDFPELPNLKKLCLQADYLTEEEWQRLSQCQAFPALRSLEFKVEELSAQDIFACLQNPNFSRLECLSLSVLQVMDQEFVEVLEQCDGLQRLRELKLDFFLMEMDAVSRLLASPYLDNLESLSICGNENYTSLGEEELRFVVDRDALPSLKKLHLFDLDLEFDAAFITTLIQLSCIQQLEELTFHATTLRVGDFQSLCEARPPLKTLKVTNSNLSGGDISCLDFVLPTLEFLELENAMSQSTPLWETEFDSWKKVEDSPLHTLKINKSRLNDAHMTTLASLPWTPSLRALELFDNEIGVRGMQTILRSTWMSKVESLKLGKNPIGNGGFDGFEESILGGHLKTLLLSGSPFTRRDLQELSTHPRLSLKYLHVENCKLDSDGLHSLLRSPVVRGLHTLSLRNTEQDSRVLEALLQHDHLPELRELHLEQNNIRDVSALVAYEGAPRLRKLFLMKNPLNKASVRGLSKMTSLLVLQAFGHKVKSNDFLEVLRQWDNPHLHELDLTPSLKSSVPASFQRTAKQNPALMRVRSLQWTSYTRWTPRVYNRWD